MSEFKLIIRLSYKLFLSYDYNIRTKLSKYFLNGDLITSNDNIDDGAPIVQSRVVFRAIGGLTYWIAVDGALGAQGDFRLNWAPSARLSAAVAGSNLKLTISLAAAGAYQLEQSTNLMNWFFLQALPTNTNSMLIDVGPATGSRRFFRVAQ